MKSVIKKVFSDEVDDEVHQYFIRYGKGQYARRFILSLAKGKNIKLRGSFEWANDFTNFVRELGSFEFSGMILAKEQLPGKSGKKTKGVFGYEVKDSNLEGYEGAYWYLVNTKADGVLLKIKKSLPKPGKSENKIDDKFCALDLDLKYWDKVKEVFFWDVPECKKALIEHNLEITAIDMPKGVSDPAEIRRLSKRVGVMKRVITIDGTPKVVEKKINV